MRDDRREEYTDQILKRALVSGMEPDEKLNRKILQKWEECNDMRKKSVRRVYMATAAAACMLLVTVTAGAAARYLNPAEAAEKAECAEIAAAFRGEDALEINESKEGGAYRFTLMGITSSESLDSVSSSAEFSSPGETCAVIAIERLDGAPMPSVSEDAYGDLELFISPLIEGLAPWQYNMASMNGGYSAFVQNGVLYRVIACDDISKFADRKLWLCVLDSTFYDVDAYRYDDTTGQIARSEDYNGINLLFDLPLDPEKADPAAAELYLKELEASWKSGETETDAGNKTFSDDMTTLTEGGEVTTLTEDVEEIQKEY